MTKVRGYTRHQHAKRINVSKYTRKTTVKSHRRHKKAGAKKTFGVDSYHRKATVKAHIRPQHGKYVKVKGYKK